MIKRKSSLMREVDIKMLFLTTVCSKRESVYVALVTKPVMGE